MSKLLILGAGGHGKVVAEIASLIKQWDEIAFLDDNEELKEVNGYKVIDKLRNYKLYKEEYEHAFVAIGNNKFRINLIDKLLKEGFKIPVLIHPFTAISSNVNIGKGTVVMAGAVINTNTVIGKGCIINTSSSIDHDCILEDGVHISPGVHVGGTVNIGKCAWVCIGSSIANNIAIGKNVIVAAEAAVTKNVPDNVMVAGVPAIFKKNTE
ncbi:acetyltransferase [Garciella nitratireducens]|uniref:acetyltransferase n=1 Tax=Garciella nitratireducens TaxID=218205 RepID=UPI001BD5B2CC|nr:acetyltransferase [Garciella nitratireducens]